MIKYPNVGMISRDITLIFFALCIYYGLLAQIDNTGCVGAGFGMDAGLYSGVIEYGDGSPASGSNDWFYGGVSGRGVIDTSNKASLITLLMGGGNPTFENRMAYGGSSIVGSQILIDGVFARDQFGGTGAIDISSFETASKNGEDPAIWDAGEANVLGKNDIVDAAGHMFREGTGLTDDLWFVGLINRAEPGGSAYMDFEFFVEDVAFNSTPVSGDAGEGSFTSGGPDLGHTAFQFDASGNITSVGDFIFNTSLINGGVEANVEMRLWVSRDDYNNVNPVNFSWGSEFDGGFNGSPYGYASIVPNDAMDACGYVNLENETPAAPPWGTLNTKDHTYGTTYEEYSIVEVGVNMTAFGVDHASLLGSDPCEFPINTFMVKTRASASFTAQLKDYSGPYQWGTPTISAASIGDPTISCESPTVTLASNSSRNDLVYQWTTVDGNIISDPTLSSITVDEPGTYTLTATLPTTCELDASVVSVTVNATRPLFDTPTATPTVACNGNDGTIDLTISGGTPPYSYDWSNNATVEDPSGLPPGTYSVTISDAFGCEIIKDNIVVEGETVPSYSDVTANVDCHGNNTGSIDLSVTGNGPFTYKWSNGSGSEDISSLAAGTYTVTTTDNDGCTETTSVTITEPSDFSPSISKTDDTDPDPGVSNGSIDLTITGATPSYTYDWSNDGPEDPDNDPQDLSGLPAGTYTVTITDQNGCTSTISTTLYEPEICNDGIDNDGDGLTDCFDMECIPAAPGGITAASDPVCVGDTDITYTISDTGADSYQWTVPAGATIQSGQGTVSITVDWMTNDGGQICVKSVVDGCESTSGSCFDVTLNDVPPQPAAIQLNGNN